MVESTALEMRHTGNRIGGSNPSLSANFMSIAVCPSPPLSTENSVLKGPFVHTVYVWRTVYANISLAVMGMVMGN